MDKVKPDESWVHYVLIVRGVWGRNRTVKFDTWTLFERLASDEAQPSDDEVRRACERKLAEIGFRRGQAKVEVQPVERSFYPPDSASGGRPVVIQSITFSANNRTVCQEVRP